MINSIITVDCDHVVAICGNENIKASTLDAISKDWVAKVKNYNAKTDRCVVFPPAELITVPFCCNCGNKLDRKISEEIIHQHFIKD